MPHLCISGGTPAILTHDQLQAKINWECKKSITITVFNFSVGDQFELQPRNPAPWQKYQKNPLYKILDITDKLVQVYIWGWADDTRRTNTLNRLDRSCLKWFERCELEYPTITHGEWILKKIAAPINNKATAPISSG